MSRVLPMFPLGSVLLPHAVLPLHVFEPRYQEMMRTLDPADPEFGVVLIQRGSEVGGHDVRSSLGTVARVVEQAELPDGRWVLVAVGTVPFVVDDWLEDDPFPRAVVSERPDLPWAVGGDQGPDVAVESPETTVLGAERLVRRALALAVELGDSNAAATFELQGSPSERVWQLTVLAPLGPSDRQRLLGQAEPGRRCAQLIEMVSDCIDLLAFRMGGG